LHCCGGCDKQEPSWEKETVFIGIDDYMALYSPYIKRAEGRDLAQCYVVGLMMDGDRKSVEPMSEKVHASERGMQRLLTEIKWDRDGAFGEYRRRMLAETFYSGEIGHPGGGNKAS
jgi:SRSO17 transposase